MATIKTKSRIAAVEVPANATPVEAAAVVARAMGDNSKVKATDLEPVILRSHSARAELLALIRRAPHEQAEFQMRCMIAEAYARSYQDMNKDNAKAPRNADGALIIPPLNDKVRAHWHKVLTGCSPKATPKEGQHRCDAREYQLKSTLRTWWTRLLFDAGVKTMATRGGAHGNRHTVTKVTQAAAPVVAKGAQTTAEPAKVTVSPVGHSPAVPRVHTPLEACGFLQKEAALMLRFVNHNLDPVMKGKPSPAEPFEKLIGKFVRDLAAIGRKFDKAKGK